MFQFVKCEAIFNRKRNNLVFVDVILFSVFLDLNL